VREKFDGKKWTLPARVYARPLEHYESLALTPALFDRELDVLGYRTVSQVREPGQLDQRVQGGVITNELHTRGFEFWDGRDSAQRFSVSLAGNRVVRLVDGSGNALPLVRLEPEQIGGIYPTQREDRLL